jgi:hypothetical protein
MSREQLQRQCLTLERQKEFHKKQAERREQETTDNLDKRRWRSKLTVPKVGKGLGSFKYPEWVATLTNLEKANGIPSQEATQFWKEGLDNEAAGEAHECKMPVEVKEVARKLYWTDEDRKRSEVEFAGFRRIPGETILQTKKCYISTPIGTRKKVSEEKKVEKFAEAFMSITAIAITLNDRKEKWHRNWDILLETLQSEVFKRAIKDDVKREDKIKEDTQLFQIRKEKRQARKNRAKKGDSEKGKKKFFCKNHPNSNTHNTKDCQIITINGHKTRVVIDSWCKHVLTSSKFHNKSTQGNPRLQTSNLVLSGASNEHINML